MSKRLIYAAAALLGLAGCRAVAAQTPPPPAWNASVSDFGTTYIFSPPPVCPGCIETEFGFQSVQDGRYLPAVLSFAPFRTQTDINVLVNLFDSEAPGRHRATHFGNRFDFVLRQQAFQKANFLLSVAPRGTVFDRGAQGGRAGATLAPQYGKGNNLLAANFSWTGAVGVSPANPRSDYLTSIDYFRTLTQRGTAFFLGLQQEATAGQQTVGTEEGLVIPFPKGQVELATQQLTLNTSPTWQFQTRVIVNWGKVLARKSHK